MKQPDQVLGVAWGEDAHAVADRLGVACGEWEPWGDGTRFETCLAAAPSTFFGRECHVLLVRYGMRLEGLQFLFPGHAGSQRALREAIRTAFGLEVGGDPDLYHGTGGGGLVRFTCDEGGACTLTVAGPHLGNVYAARELARGLGALGASLRP
ncbi:MAG: hypothetical protein ACRDJW_03725 [Thermomicrobiales bacterium]